MSHVMKWSPSTTILTVAANDADTEILEEFAEGLREKFPQAIPIEVATDASEESLMDAVKSISEGLVAVMGRDSVFTTKINRAAVSGRTTSASTTSAEKQGCCEVQ